MIWVGLNIPALFKCCLWKCCAFIFGQLYSVRIVLLRNDLIIKIAVRCFFLFEWRRKIAEEIKTKKKATVAVQSRLLIGSSEIKLGDMWRYQHKIQFLSPRCEQDLDWMTRQFFCVPSVDRLSRYSTFVCRTVDARQGKSCQHTETKRDGKWRSDRARERASRRESVPVEKVVYNSYTKLN